MRNFYSLCKKAIIIVFLRNEHAVGNPSVIEGQTAKAPCKSSQYCWLTRRNIVGPNMLRAFAHHVVCCCVLLRPVGSCWMKFETGQTSSNIFQQQQQHATTHNMVCKRSQHVEPNNVASVCTGLNILTSRTGL